MPESPAGPSSDRRLKAAITLIAAGALVSLSMARTADLMWDRQRHLQEAERRAANLALILAEYLTQTFEGADATLRQLAIHGARIDGASGSADWRALLDAARAGIPGLGALSIIDAGGMIRHSTRPIVGQSRRDTYLFQRLSMTTNDVLVADRPFPTQSTPSQLILPLGRRLSDADGRFDGAIVASFYPGELRGFFKTVDTGARGVVWVFHPDGLVLVREPSTADPLGSSAAGNPIFEAARETPARVVRGPAREGGEPFVSASHSVADPPLVVAVSLSQAEVLAEWTRELRLSAAVLALMALMTGGALLLVFRQIDRRLTAEQALARAQRLESLGRLTGGVAHDFNNLLTVILGYAAILREGPATTPAAADGLAEIEGAATRAATLTKQLLAFARRQPLHPVDVDVHALLSGLQPMLRRVIGEDVQLRLTMRDAPCVARVDAVQLETSLINLCVNARDAMPDGGVLAIETRKTVVEKSRSWSEGDMAPGRYVEISVSDSGVGISPEHLSRVLEPFFTTKSMGKGTGLGLSIVYGFAKQSGGDVKVYSEVGRGTAVKIYLPESTTARIAGVEPALSAGIPRGQGETILLVEDEDAVRKLTTRLLTDLGYQVVAVPDGPSAVAAARTMARLDVLLTDVVLPGGLNGPQLADALGTERPGLPVVFASGYSEDILAHRGMDEGVRLVPKPFDRRTLAVAMKAALNPSGPGSSGDRGP